MKRILPLLIIFIIFVLTACNNKTVISLPSKDTLKQINVYEEQRLKKSITDTVKIENFLNKINNNLFNILSQSQFEDLLCKKLSNKHTVVSLIEGDNIYGYLFIWEKSDDIIFQDLVNKNYYQSEDDNLVLAKWLKETEGDLDLPQGEITVLNLKLPQKCTSKSIVINTDIIPISDADEEVINWIKSLNQQQQGIFWARRELSNQQEQYLMYGNNLQVILKATSSELDGKGIFLQLDSYDSYNSEDLYVFTTQNHKAQYLIVNDHRINISDIPILKNE